MKPRVAVVGSGISGLSVAWSLAEEAEVTLFEAGSHFGGHSNTVDVTLDGVTHGVDTGFLVYNHRTYPNLVRLFAELGIETAASDMSFSVQSLADGIEWSGSDLNTVFAQRRNLARPAFLRMLADILRFNKLCTALAQQGADEALAEPIGMFLDRHGFSAPFREWYFLPMIGCIWSCPTEQMLRFPVGTMIRFCHNHGLLQVADRPQWHTVRGGSRHYVQAMLKRIGDARLRTPVHGVRRVPADTGSAGVWVATDHGEERFDDLVLACHSDQALALMSDASEAERQWLGSLRYHDNRAVLHTDVKQMPRRRLAWASWNYERGGSDLQERSAVCLHYWINRLQPLPWSTPVIVSLNPARPVDPACVIAEMHYSHPVFDEGAVRAQKRIAEFQGRGRVWYCGAWTRYGFHEDGLMSGLAVVQGLREQWQRQGVQPRAA